MPMSSRLQVGKSSVVNFRCSSQVASSKNKFPTCPIWRGIRSLDNAGMSCSNCGRASLAFPRTVAKASAGIPVDTTSGLDPTSTAEDSIPDVARQNLESASNACKRFGWIAFWFQLVLTIVAAVIILFSMAFTSQQGPQVSLYLTLFGIMTGFISTFWSFGYTRLARKLQMYVDSGASGATPRIRRTDVINMLEKGAILNILGAGASMIGLQATIGLLVAKTLTTATVNPFLASNTNTWNPVLAFDVFNVQATTNTLLSHFFSLIVTLWLLRKIANRPSAARVVTSKSKL